MSAVPVHPTGHPARSSVGAWLWLVAAMISEIVATGSLHLTHGFTDAVPTIVVIVGYCLSFFCLTNTAEVIPLGLAYAVWTALGTIAVCIIGVVALHQAISWPAGIGIALIVIGVCVINLRGGGIVRPDHQSMASEGSSVTPEILSALDESPPR